MNVIMLNPEAKAALTVYSFLRSIEWPNEPSRSRRLTSKLGRLGRGEHERIGIVRVVAEVKSRSIVVGL